MGVGTSRVRELIEQARKKTPYIFSVEEIVAIGKERVICGALVGINYERGTTLNKLLEETDRCITTAQVMSL